MGKKRRKKNKVSAQGKPTVSICTPTYNRREFIPSIIKCYMAQTYPRKLMEWIVIDDDTDPVGDLFEGMESVKYFYQEEKMKLGQKRNYMHEKATGDIIIYMDDDDFYPPDRVNHAVNKLRSRPDVLVAGSSQLYIYFKHIDKIWLFGPYGPFHATAGTFAFKRELLKHTRYDDDAKMSEEKVFLKNYSIPLVQLDPRKSILVFAHDHNTFDKRRLLMTPHPKYARETKLRPSNFIKDKQLREFYKGQ